MTKAVAMFVALALVAVVATTAGGAVAAPCNPGQLAVCKSAMHSGVKPSAVCCSNLRAQKACLCQYAKDPKFSRYVHNPNVPKTITSCGIATPKC